MDLNRIKTVEEFVIETRDKLGFDNIFEHVDEYTKLTFDILEMLYNLLNSYSFTSLRSFLMITLILVLFRIYSSILKS